MSAATTAPLPPLEDGIALMDYLASGHTLGPLLGHTAQAQETMYALAHRMYGQAKYDDAARIFSHLVTCNHMDARFFVGFGACMQMKGRHPQALKFYGVASVLDLADPTPVMHMAECHLALGDHAQARTAIARGLDLASGNDRHRATRARLEAMRAFLQAARADRTVSQGEDQ